MHLVWGIVCIRPFTFVCPKVCFDESFLRQKVYAIFSGLSL